MSIVGQYLAEQMEAAHSGDEQARRVLINNGYLSVVSASFYAAETYCQRFKWAIIPQCPGTKKPHVKWKAFKDELRPPTTEQIYGWYSRWLDAGIIVLLGPVSGLFAIDVDGEAAHAELVKRIGRLPVTACSWRGKQFRYHLLFQNPAEVTTIAKYTPWHPNLEFRGHGGYVVIPPSKHESGKHYRWTQGHAPHQIPLAAVPDQILRALKDRSHRSKSQSRSSLYGSSSVTSNDDVRLNHIPGIVQTTRRFLAGRFAFESGWNDRLFRAACDLAGNHVDEDRATKLLLAGAKPVGEPEREMALATIKSAYSTGRTPARSYRTRKATWGGK
ncbi:MAG: bifunctional DNA primase/polymerase [Planctomycetes bacterium]|nr:bifunctional DNA primase/polymerase [Planctomycetota bacterium]